jgi:hypothetical protein
MKDMKNKKKKGHPTKKDRGKQKLRKALEAGAGVAEISSSKIAWDMAHDKMRIASGKFDYRTHQVLDCVADQISQDHWFGVALGLQEEPNTDEPERFLVPVTYKQFLDFIDDRSKLSTSEVIELFKSIPEITLEGEVDIPYCLSESRWLRITSYKDNICGVAVAHEHSEFEKYRSGRKLRGRGAGEEEPVFILLFSSPYGIAFFRNAMHQYGNQLIDRSFYHLRPEAQSLYQSVRWKRGIIHLNIEQISKAVGWTWPPNDFKDRVYRIRRLLDILHEHGFINKPPKSEDFERGGSWETRAWTFYVRKGKKPVNMEIIRFRPLKMTNFPREN